MKTLQKKSLSIDAETHKKIAIASVETGRDMWELIRDAWAGYSAGPTAVQDSQELRPTFEPVPGCITSEERRLWGQVQHLMADPKLAPVLRGLIALLDDDTLGQTAAPSTAHRQADRRRAPQKQKGMTPE